MFQKVSELKIGFLISGDLGKKVLDFCLDFVEPEFIATDKNSNEIIDLANRKGIRTFVGNPRGGRLVEFLGGEYFDIFLSINYLFIIEKDVISRAKYPVNFHGSLLPKYRGRTPHVWAIINNENATGVTAHIIEEGCDTGPILMQRRIDISKTMTGANVLDKFNLLYPKMVKQVLKDIISNNISMRNQDDSKATTFEKRTPEDGGIDWNWQWERINNWVRALARPYPGAFGFLNENKIIIDKVTFCEMGYNSKMSNGQIIGMEKGKPIVKVSNGALILESIRNSKGLIFKVNEKFDDSY